MQHGLSHSQAIDLALNQYHRSPKSSGKCFICVGKQLVSKHRILTHTHIPYHTSLGSIIFSYLSLWKSTVYNTSGVDNTYHPLMSRDIFVLDDPPQMSKGAELLVTSGHFVSHTKVEAFEIILETWDFNFSFLGKNRCRIKNRVDNKNKVL